MSRNENALLNKQRFGKSKVVELPPGVAIWRPFGLVLLGGDPEAGDLETCCNPRPGGRDPTGALRETWSR